MGEEITCLAYRGSLTGWTAFTSKNKFPDATWESEMSNDTDGLDKLTDAIIELNKMLTRGVNNLEMLNTILLLDSVDMAEDDYKKACLRIAEHALLMREITRESRRRPRNDG